MTPADRDPGFAAPPRPPRGGPRVAPPAIRAVRVAPSTPDEAEAAYQAVLQACVAIARQRLAPRGKLPTGPTGLARSSDA